MSGEFRYPLTRYCLRSGTMTLPQAMVGLFPEGGLRAVDTKTGQELELAFTPPRTVSGLGELYRSHGLAVNDELHVKALDDGRFAITPVARPRAPDYSTAEGLARLLDDLSQSGLRMTVQEIRAYYEVPEEVDLAAALAADGRFAQREGRWLDAATAAEDVAAAEVEPAEDVAAAAERAEGGAVAAERAESGAAAGQATRPAARGGPDVDVPSDAGAAAGGERLPDDELVSVGAARSSASQQDAGAGADGVRGGASAEAAYLGDGPATAERSVGPEAAYAGAGAESAAPVAQPGLWPRGGVAPQQRDAGPTRARRARGDVEEPRSVQERRAPAPAPARPPAIGLDEEDEASLEATALVDRLRRVLAPLGFVLEPIARGQVSLVAHMGRRGYKALVQLLSRTERVDWADLLSKRRALDYRHLAVVGEHQALLRLTGPAELARATLWSWQGLERLASLQASLPLSPVDLEPHFERDGLFEQGLERFEAKVAERLAERGALSEVLARLNLLRAPTVFLLEDLVSEVALPRDRVLAILERLSAAPFALLARVDTGEFVLRQPVGAALEALSGYALSLRERLPSRHTERLTGHGEPLLLDEAEDLGGADDDEQAAGGIEA